MLADGHEPALVHDHDAVRVGDRAEPVGNDEGRAVLEEQVEGLVDLVLGLGVDLAGGFVEDEDRRVAEDGPGDGDPLPLPAGERRPVLADDRVVAAGDLLDELVGERLSRRLR